MRSACVHPCAGCVLWVLGTCDVPGSALRLRRRAVGAMLCVPVPTLASLVTPRCRPVLPPASTRDSAMETSAERPCFPTGLWKGPQSLSELLPSFGARRIRCSRVGLRASLQGSAFPAPAGLRRAAPAVVAGAGCSRRPAGSATGTPGPEPRAPHPGPFPTPAPAQGDSRTAQGGASIAPSTPPRSLLTTLFGGVVCVLES